MGFFNYYFKLLIVFIKSNNYSRKQRDALLCKSVPLHCECRWSHQKGGRTAGFLRMMNYACWTLRTGQHYLVSLPCKLCWVGLDKATGALDKNPAHLCQRIIRSALGISSETSWTSIIQSIGQARRCSRFLAPCEPLHSGTQDIWHPELIARANDEWVSSTQDI